MGMNDREKHKATNMVLVSDTHVFFWTPPSAFDQWMPCHFEVDGLVYSSTEQFMMAAKAKLFDDMERWKAIMSEHDPRKIIRHGKKVQGFNENVWAANRFDVVVAGNAAKYEQNSGLRRQLLATGSRILVEASASDRIWGIGLAPADAMQAVQSEPWRFPLDCTYSADSYTGLNLLGQALMTVRTKLLADQ